MCVINYYAGIPAIGPNELRALLNKTCRVGCNSDDWWLEVSRKDRGSPSAQGLNCGVRNVCLGCSCCGTDTKTVSIVAGNIDVKRGQGITNGGY